MDNSTVVRDLAIALSDANIIKENAIPYAVVPSDYDIRSLEFALEKPSRKKAGIALFDARSFIDYFNLHKTESSRIYAQGDNPVFVGVIDDHGKEAAGWCDHIARYKCPISKEWSTWRTFSGTRKTQVEFAEFIEENTPDIFSENEGEPSAADMLQVATNFKAQKKVTYSSGKRLDNGQVNFEYAEDIQGSAGAKGAIRVPESFWIAIPVFEGGKTYKIECKLRWRLKDGELLMWFDLFRAHKILEAAFLGVWEEIEKGVDTKIWHGSI